MNIKAYILAALAAMMVLAAASCDSEVTVVATDDVYMRFVISTGTPPGSRAPGVWEEDDEDAVERQIFKGDVRFYIFDNNDRLQCMAREADFRWVATGNDGYYDIVAAISRADYEAIETSTAGNTFNYRLAILANLAGAGGSYPALAAGDSYSVLDPVFTLAADYYPDIDAGRGIPMYGVSCLSVDLTRLKDSTLDMPLAGGSVNMLRSLCKVDVSEAMTNSYQGSDGLVYPRITAVELAEWNDRGYIRFAPVHDNDYFQDNVIVSARLVGGDAGGEPRDFENAGEKKHRLYLPESKLEQALLAVTAIRAPGAEPEQFTYRLSQASFGVDELIRNHIYTLRVTAIGATAVLEAAVKPWQAVDSEIDFSQSVSQARMLTWEIGGDDDDFAANAAQSTAEKPVLHIYNGTERYVRATFEISSPAGARWTAQIVPGANGVNAFEFVTLDDAGNVVSASPVAQGLVGAPSQICLRGVGGAPAVDCYGDLVITVRMADGTAMNLPFDIYQNTRFGLIRHRPLFDNL